MQGEALRNLHATDGLLKGQSIEIDEEAVLRCMTKGLNVFHDDIDRGLSEYEDRSFDFVILNQTFQHNR